MVDGPSHGSVSLNSSTGVATYVPDDGYVGGDAFTYTVYDGSSSYPLDKPTATVTLAVNGGSFPGAVFDDVASTYIFFDDIAWLASSGITKGCSASLFCPEDAVTRAQLASFLVRALELPAAPAGADTFSDDDGSVHEADIEALAASGITKGCSATEFCPNDPVTRAQLASFLVRGLDDVSAIPGADTFTDDDGSVHEADIEGLAASGITRGCGDGCSVRRIR